MRSKFIVYLSFLFIFVKGGVAFASDPTAQSLLERSNQASQQLNFELSYIVIKNNSIEPILYRQALNGKQRLAQLIYLSGQAREVILRGSEVSYIEPGIEPFTLKSKSMVAPLMPLLHMNLEALANAYDLVMMGRAREAGVATSVIRVVPKDGKRYSYMVWIDEKSYLPVRGDLIDRDGEILEQYRVVSFRVDNRTEGGLLDAMRSLNEVQLPPVFSLPKQEVENIQWQVGFAPQGFKPKPHTRYRIPITGKIVETQMFSDGLFQFSVYVAKKDELTLKGQLVRQGRRTLHTMQVMDKEIVVVGDIPPKTAKEIARSVNFKKTGVTAQ